MNFTINAEWDTEAQVWVAESTDNLGIATEAPSIEELAKKLQIIVPEIAQANQLISPSYSGELTYQIICTRNEKVLVA